MSVESKERGFKLKLKGCFRAVSKGFEVTRERGKATLELQLTSLKLSIKDWKFLWVKEFGVHFYFEMIKKCEKQDKKHFFGE